MRNKAANLFSPSFRSAVKDVREAPVGLFGGETAIRSRLAEATKEDELLAKTLNKPFKSRKGGKRGGRNKYKGTYFSWLKFIANFGKFQEIQI